MTTEQFIRQQILGFRPYPRWCAAVDLEHFLCFIKCGTVNQRWHTTLIADVVENINAGVFFIFQ